VGCDADARPDPEPALIPGVTDAVDVTGDDWGGFCALRKDRSVVCWPAGKGAVTPVAGVAGAVDVSTPCALLEDHSVTCWGEQPVAPNPRLENVTALSRGFGGSMCVLQSGGKASCWGQSAMSYLPGPPGTSVTPEAVVGLAGALEIDLSSIRGACARVDGGVKCWGGEFSPPIHSVRGLTAPTQVSLADYHGCARLKDGGVACWGENASGQLGVPAAKVERSDSAILVRGLKGVVEVTCGGGEPNGGGGSSCALTTEGKVLCWGDLGGAEGATPVDLSVPEDGG